MRTVNGHTYTLQLPPHCHLATDTFRRTPLLSSESMSVSKLPLLSHGVQSINFAKEPAALSVLLPCPSRIRLFSPFFTTAIGGSGVVKCRGTRHSRGGEEGLRKESFVEEDDDDERGERKVRCEVDVISWRERRIRGEIWVDSDSQSVWDVLTDYERLADFIPNLVSR